MLFELIHFVVHVDHFGGKLDLSIKSSVDCRANHFAGNAAHADYVGPDLLEPLVKMLAKGHIELLPCTAVSTLGLTPFLHLLCPEWYIRHPVVLLGRAELRACVTFLTKG